MPLFTKKAPPIWYVLYPDKSSNPDNPPKREGPYTRNSIVQLLAQGKLSGGALIWTNEKIFPNAERPNSSRCVRILEWRRFDQLPDPVTREFELAAQKYRQIEVPSVKTEQEEQTPPPVPSHSEIERLQNNPPPPPPSGGQQVQQPPPGQSIYPAGAFTAMDDKDDQYPQGTADQSPHVSGGLPSAYPKPSTYPGGAYPH